MTCLSLQLRNLSTAQTNLLDHKKTRASILFSAAEASSHSRDTVYKIGLSGYNELLKINNQFAKFSTSLFDEKSKDMQRAVQTKEVNESLDATIDEFLILLSPYLEKTASLKALEWLVHRYMIHEMNLESLMACILPFYETNIFARIIQIVTFQGQGKSWFWLNMYGKNARAIPKRTMYTRWAKSPGFRNFHTKSFKNLLAVTKEENMRIPTAYYITTILGGIYIEHTLKEEHLSCIMMNFSTSIRSGYEELIAGTYLLITHLAVKTTISEGLLQNILCELCVKIPHNLLERFAVCLLVICHHQNVKLFPMEVQCSLQSNKDLLKFISSLAREKCVSAFFCPIIHGGINSFFSDDLSDDEIIEEFDFLVDLITSTPFAANEAAKVLSTFMAASLECVNGFKKLTKQPDFASAIREFEDSHPEGCDEVRSKIQLFASVFGIKEIKSEEVEIVEPKVKKIPKEMIWQRSFRKGLIPEDINVTLKMFDKRLKVFEAKENKPFWLIDLEENSELAAHLNSVFEVFNLALGEEKKAQILLRSILKSIFRDKMDLRRKLYFLSIIWSWHPEYSFGLTVSHPLKLMALKLAEGLLKGSKESYSWLLDPKEIFFSSLLVALCEGAEEISLSVFRVMAALTTVPGTSLKNAAYSSAIREIIENEHEITADISFLPIVLSKYIHRSGEDGQKLSRHLTSCVVDCKTPVHIKATLLYVMSNVHDGMQLVSLEPVGRALLTFVGSLKKEDSLIPLQSLCLYYILLRISKAEAAYFERKSARVFLLSCILSQRQTLQVTGKKFSPLELVTTKHLLRNITDPKLLKEIINLMIAQAVQSSNSQEAAKLRKHLKKIPMQASLIVEMIDELELIPKVLSVKEARLKKLRWRQHQNEAELKDIDWKKLGLAVELVGVMPNLKESWLLLGPLCRHLKQIVSLETSSSDLLEQQILSVIHHLVQTTSQELNKEQFAQRVELDVVVLVQCIRMSTNPDTHRRALLILALAAEYYPDTVLQNILSIFTFMGSSLLRRDDSYSFQVIEQTISSIVPTLIKSESSSRRVLLPKLSKVCRVFVDALPDLPTHRRLPLFLQLAKTIGVSQFLWLLFALIADSFVTVKGDYDYRRSSEDVNFIAVLFGHFSVPDQLKAFCELIQCVSYLPDDRDVYAALKVQDRNTYTLIINVKGHTNKQLRHLKHAFVCLMTHILTSEVFINQILEMTAEKGSTSELSDLYEFLLNKSTTFWEELREKEISHKDTSFGRYYCVMQRKVLDVVNSVSCLLPPPLLMDVVFRFLSYETPSVKLKALELLASKLQPSVEFFREDERDQLLSFVDILIKISGDASETPENRQNSFYVLQLIIHKLENVISEDALLSALNVSTFTIQEAGVSSKISSSAMLVVGESVRNLKLAAAPLLKMIMKILLNVLGGDFEQNSHSDSVMVISSSLYTLEKVAESMPEFLRKYLAKLLGALCKLSHTLTKSSSLREAHLKECVGRINLCLISKTQPELFIPAVEKTYHSLVRKFRSGIPVLMEVLESFFDIHPKSLPLYKKQLMEVFMSALGLRGEMDRSSADADAELDTIEKCTMASLSRLLLKLNEDDNVSIFTSIQNWASQEEGSCPDRLITFFRLSDYLASSFKVLFIKAKLAEKVFDLAVDVLAENNNLIHDATVFGDEPAAEENCSLLLKYVLDTLTKVFTYDSVQFTNEDRFNVVLKPLTDQLENTIGGDELYERRIEEQLKPCIVKFTIAIADDSLWKELNRLILLRVRNDESPKIILAALKTFEGLMETLGEDYLQPLLPDIMTYLTEVLESLDSDVEEKARKILNKIESILGENLRMFLDT